MHCVICTHLNLRHVTRVSGERRSWTGSSRRRAETSNANEESKRHSSCPTDSRAGHVTSGNALCAGPFQCAETRVQHACADVIQTGDLVLGEVEHTIWSWLVYVKEVQLESQTNAALSYSTQQYNPILWPPVGFLTRDDSGKSSNLPGLCSKPCQLLP